VVFYHFYYQDLPIYLNRQILLVKENSTHSNRDNWQHDFQQGLYYKPYQHIMLSNKEFSKLWHGTAHVYVFTTQSKFADFKKAIGRPFYILGRYAKLILVSNYQPPSHLGITH
jgi:hypothetical protein